MKKYLIGFIVGAMCMLSTNAFAAVGDKIEAVFSQFTFVVNGETLELEADPINYQGTTYLPVRVVANMLGYDVTYKHDSRTIELDLPIEQPVHSPEQAPTAPIEPPKQQEVTTPSPDVQESVESQPEVVEEEEETVEEVVEIEDPKVDPAVCEGIHRDYNVSMAELNYEKLAEGPRRQKAIIIEYNRDQALSAAGCN